MTPVEELLRSATKEAAGEITPESVRPFEIATLRGPHAVRRQAARRLTIPLAAAAAVVAVAGLSLALPRLLGSPQAAAAKKASVSAGASLATPARSSSAPSPPAPPAVTPVPAIYAALTGVTYPWYDHPLDITVRNTETGAVLATVKPPAPYGTFAFLGQGSSSAGTFLVGVQYWQPVSNSRYTDNNNAAPITLLLLHFDQTTRNVSFTSLPAPVLPGLEAGAPVLEGASLSPDGTKLAVATGNAVPPGPTSLQLSVYSLLGGAVHTWSLYGTIAAKSQDAVSALSWLADGHTLAFNMTGLDPAGTTTVNQVRKLDVSGPGGGLLGASQLVFSLDASTFLCQDSLLLSPDGTTVACAGQIPLRAGQQSITYGFAEFSVATGRLTGILARTADGVSVATSEQLFWWDGHDTLIGTLDGPVFILRGGTEQAIPWSSRISGPQGGPPEVAW